MIPEINIDRPKIIQASARREELPVLYAEVLAQNPLLARVEAQCRLIGWTDAEVRTMQLLLACRSNASLTQRLTEMEQSLAIFKE